MSKLRSINTRIWSDSWFEELEPESKLLFIYLITNDINNMLGVYEISIRKISFDTGIDKTRVQKALEDFERANKVKYAHGYIMLNNFIKHQSYNKNMKISAVNVYNELPSELKQHDLQFIDNQDINKGFERLCKGFGIVRKIEDESKDESKDECEEENTIAQKNNFLHEKDLLNKVYSYFDLKVIESLNEKSKNKWLDEIRKLHEIDNYSFAEIQETIIWGRQDEFWSNNFHSILGLRQKGKDGTTKFYKINKKMKADENKNYNSKRAKLAREIAADMAADPFFSQKR